MKGAGALGFLTSSGERAAAVVPLTWFMGTVSAVVCVIVAVLLWLGISRRRSSVTDARMIKVERGGDGLDWIKWGMALTAVPLLVTLVWTMAVLGRIVGPPRNPPLTIDVTGQRWWWAVRYPGFATANEIHIPTGSRVLVRLHGADVIHSFWVPQLSGKTDTIPGQTNLAWIEADRPGRYRGQCAEYCGLEHARMAFEVVADPPAQFALWREAQMAAAPAPATPGEMRGLAVFQNRCASCHVVREAGGASGLGPDLTHLMSRRLIAGGALPNTRGGLAGWIESPQSAKPGALMPGQQLNGQELNDIVAYLETLK